MCGFAGECLTAGGQLSLAAAERMAATLAHRGPDETGSFLSADRRCAIGFRRLSVIDPPLSHQPMTSPCGRITIAFNGEIYNFRQLRLRLQQQSHVFRTFGDTEVLLHLYERHGLEMFEHIDGMFALAIYDGRSGRLLLARDRLGQKPLWYAVLGDRVLFASQAKALLAHGGVAGTVSPQALAAYLTFGYVPAAQSAFCGLNKLAPATYVTVKQEVAPPERYWRPRPAYVEQSDAASIEQTRQLVVAAVESHLVSDVPVGALLSGGVDSSVVVAAMTASCGKAGGVRTFTAGFQDDAYDERPFAAQVASHLGTEHTELVIQPAPHEALARLVRLYDEPFADSSALATFLICQAARQHVKVALVGDGGDEVFAGYDRYRALYLAQTLSPIGYLGLRLAATAVRPLAPINERSRLRRLVRLARNIDLPPAQQYLAMRAIFQASDLPRLMTADYAASLDLDAPCRWFMDLYEQADLPDEVLNAQFHDLMTYLPDDLLVKTDIASMAVSLELRAPLLDHRLVAHGLGLPLRLRLNWRRGKLALRRAFAAALPESVLHRPKRGFGIPLGRWLRDELREEMRQTLLDRSFLGRGMFRQQAIAGLINDHLSGRDDHTHRLWALMFLARWLDFHA